MKLRFIISTFLSLQILGKLELLYQLNAYNCHNNASCYSHSKGRGEGRELEQGLLYYTLRFLEIPKHNYTYPFTILAVWNTPVEQNSTLIGVGSSAEQAERVHFSSGIKLIRLYKGTNYEQDGWYPQTAREWRVFVATFNLSNIKYYTMSTIDEIEYQEEVTHIGMPGYIEGKIFIGYYLSKINDKYILINHAAVFSGGIDNNTEIINYVKENTNFSSYSQLNVSTQGSRFDLRGKRVDLDSRLSFSSHPSMPTITSTGNNFSGSSYLEIEGKCNFSQPHYVGAWVLVNQSQTFPLMSCYSNSSGSYKMNLRFISNTIQYYGNSTDSSLDSEGFSASVINKWHYISIATIRIDSEKILLSFRADQYYYPVTRSIQVPDIEDGIIRFGEQLEGSMKYITLTNEPFVGCHEPECSFGIGIETSFSYCDSRFISIYSYCVSTCSDYTYNSFETGFCLQCSYGCIHCTNETYCSQCDSGLNLYNNLCMEGCPLNKVLSAGVCTSCGEGLYYDSSALLCKSCLSGCKSCQNQTGCDVCFDSHIYFSNSTHSLCVSDCPDNYFNESSICTRCGLNCTECLNSSFCSICEPNYFLLQAENTNQCVEDCGFRHYADNGLMQCLECDFRCLTCFGPSNTDCFDCNTSITEVAKTGPTTCDCNSGYTFYLNQNLCHEKDSFCLELNSSNLNQCLSCISLDHVEYNPLEFTCNCEAGYYRKDNQCLQCHSFCSQCTNSNFIDCLMHQCSKNSYPLHNLPTTCLYECRNIEDNLFFDTSAKDCKECVFPCQSCFGSSTNSCLSCVSPYLLHQSQCLLECPEKYFSNSQACLPCNAGCKTCKESENKCVGGCENGYYLLDSSCLNYCTDGYYPNNFTCYSCPKSCALCQLSALNEIQCTSCTRGFVLTNYSCELLCPEGQYENNQICENCDEACQTCFGKTSHHCFTCNTQQKYKLLGKNTCRQISCMTGYYFNKSSLNCEACSSNCEICSNSLQCIECSENYKLNSGTLRCTKDCGTGFLYNEFSESCEEICGDGLHMGLLECDDGNTLDNDGCSNKCRVEDGYFCKTKNGTTDYCYVVTAPQISLSISKTNSFMTISFSRPIFVSDSILQYLKLQLLDMPENCEYSITLQKPITGYLSSLRADLQIACSIKGHQEFAQVILSNSNKFQDKNNVSISDNSVVVYLHHQTYLSPTEKKIISGIGTTLDTANVVVLVISIGRYLIQSAALNSFWSLINILQYIN